jgi:hypothetical protein
MDDLAVKLCYRGEHRRRTAWHWARQKQLPMYWRGRHRLVREDDVIEALATGRCVKGQARYLKELRGFSEGQR